MNAQTGFSSKHFTIEPLADGVFAAIHTEGGAAIGNAGLIDLGGLLLVFDTFLTPQAARDLRRFSVQIFGRVPQFVINSHYHNDHVWGNQVFADKAQIISNACTCQLFDTEGKAEFSWYRSNAAQRLQALQERAQNAQDEHERQSLEGMLGYYEGLVETMPTLTVCKPNLTFSHNLTLHGKKRSAELITYLHSHTACDSVLYLPKDGVVFTGDLLFVRSHPYLSEAKPTQLIETLKALAQLDAETYVPGHGQIGSKHDLTLLADYTQFCLDAAAEVRKAGSPEATLEQVDIPELFKDWQLPHMLQGNIKSMLKSHKRN